LIHVARRLLQNLRSDRNRPPLERLASIEEPERFTWEVLPYAARTFSFCIALLPRRTARPLAVAYRYCRMLDTCEDLPRAVAEKEAALRAMVDRFDGAAAPRPAPRLADDGLARDERDRVYLLLLRHAERVDRCFFTLPAAQREEIVRLVRRMGEGMIWAVRTFAEQGGALDGHEQLTRYCFEVLGNPLLFAEEMQRLEMGLVPEVDARRRELVAAVGEAIQLANVARDLEKDSAAGVCYDPTLRAGASAPPPAAIAAVRGRLLGRAIVLGRAFRPYMEGVPTPRFSLARGAGLALLLFTLAFWQGTARRLGLALFENSSHVTPLRATVWIVRAVFSRCGADGVLARIEGAFAHAEAALAKTRSDGEGRAWSH